MFRSTMIAGAGACLTASQALALNVGDRVDNFKLLDHNGRAHELHYLVDAEAVALMSHTVGCSGLGDDIARFETLAAEYAGRGVEFLMLNADGLSDRSAVQANTPVLIDETRVVGESLGFTAAGQVLIVDPATWRVVYRGSAAAAAARPSGALGSALEAVLADRDVAPGEETANGCSLRFEGDAGEITYTRDVAPILAANCVTCHREGGIGPWAMTGYNIVRGFAPMIREVIRTKRMPPWHADPVHGSFANDRSLSVDEIRKVVHWVEAGAPRGDGDDPLESAVEGWAEWPLGEPDLVLNIPPFDVPASGVVDYKYRYLKNPLDRDVWVRATEIVPGDRAALHHVITTWAVPNDNGSMRRPKARGGLGGYVPGSVTDEYPEGTGRLLPAGSYIIFQMHYTPYGKAVTDASRLGIYFHDEPPEHRLRDAVLLNTKIRIPANARFHGDSAERTFDEDILVYSLLPHAHYRGTASEFRAFYPDGTEEVLLSVPNYDFNWQTSYVLEEPKRLPTGTRMVHTTWWDNSPQNPANPDPDREVPWGLQSWDEMLYGAVEYRSLDTATTESRVEVAGSE